LSPIINRLFNSFQLQEIIPFYGQGSSESDSIVRETIDKLPLDALEIPDRFGNTILLLACQYAAFDLVTLLIQKGCDVNSQNNDGACCLHFSCYTDTLSEDILEVHVYQLCLLIFEFCIAYFLIVDIDQ